MYRPKQTKADPPIPPKGGSSADRENRTMNDMHEIRYEDVRELAKIASENNVEITLSVVPKRVEWIVYPLIDGGRVELECPICGDTFIRSVDYKPHFCENCGTRMKDGE